MMIQIDNLDAGFEHLGGRSLLVKRRRQPVNRHCLCVRDRSELVHGFSDHVHHAPQCSPANRDGYWPALVDGLHAANHAVGGFHGDAAHAALAQVLLHLENHVDG